MNTDPTTPRISDTQRTLSGMSASGSSHAAGFARLNLRLHAAWTLLCVGLLAYGFYALVSDSWPLDWINLAQQSVLGHYDEQLSLLVYLGLAVALVIGPWSAMERRASRRVALLPAGRISAQASTAATPPAAVPRRVSDDIQLRLKMIVGMVVALWVVGAGLYVWSSSQQREDNTAVYRPVHLDGDEAGVASGEHLAVQGVLLGSRTLTHQTDGRDDHYLVPLVPYGWRAGQAARLVVQTEQPAALPGFLPGASWRLSTPLLVRVGAALPLTATRPFAQAGVPLAPDHHVLNVIESVDGVPVRRDTDDLQIMLWVCGIGSAVLLFILAPLVWAVMYRRGRRAAQLDQQNPANHCI